MEKKSISLLVGAKTPEKAEMFAKSVAKQLNASDEFEVLKTFTAVIKDDITNSIDKKEYDVIICTEEMSENQVIGAGSVKIWREKNPAIRIFIVLKDEKKGAKKVRALFEKGYYDAIYVSEFSTGVGELVKLIEKGRTKEEAAKYYACEDMLETKEPDPESVVAQQKAPDVVPSKGIPPMPAQVDALPQMNTKQTAVPGAQFETPRESVTQFETPREAAVPYPNPIPSPTQAKQQAVQPQAPAASYINIKEDLGGFDVGDDFEQLDRQRARESAGESYYAEERAPQFMEQVEKIRASMNYRKQMEENEMSMSAEQQYGGVGMERTMSGGTGMQRTSVPPVQRRSGQFKPTVSSFEGYVVDVISDTAIVLEVPNAHFLAAKDFLSQDKVNLVTPRLA